MRVRWALKAVIFAAGLGKRLRPLTNVRPKHLLPLAGKPVLRRVLEAVEHSGVMEAGIVVSYLREKVREAVEAWPLNINLQLIDQGEAEGTGHALMAARPFLEGEEFFLVVYGDITLRPGVLRAFLEAFEESGVEGAVEGVWVENASPFGRLSERNNLLLRVEEKSGKGPGLINAGLYVLPRRALQLTSRLVPSPRGEYELTDVLNMLVSDGVKILVHRSEQGWWRDIGRPLDLLEANRALLREELGEGVKVEAEVEAELRSPSIVLRGVRVERGSRIGPEAVLMEGVKVGARSVIESSIFLESSVLEDGCRVRRAIIGDGAEVGSGSTIDGGEGVVVVAPGAKVPSNSTLRGSIIYP